MPEDEIPLNLDADPFNYLKVVYGPADWIVLQKIEQELATKKDEKWMRSELENTELREKIDTLPAFKEG